MRRALVCVCLIGSLLARSFSCDSRGDTEQLVIVVLGWQDSLDVYVLDLYASGNTRSCLTLFCAHTFGPLCSALLILSFCALTFCIVGGGMCSSSNSKQLSIARSHSASRTVVVASHKNESTIRFQCVIVLTAIAQTAVRSKNITQIFIFLAEMSLQH